jgi:outer membrane protein assembly factor BamB
MYWLTMFRLAPTSLLIFSLALTLGAHVNGTPNPQQSDTAVHLRWGERAGVSRYRLQLAADVNFRDIIFDRVINGNQTVITDVPAGNYFWRVAPLAGALGQFSSTRRIEIKPAANPPAASTTSSANFSASTNRIITSGGWRAAVGDIPRPLLAHLRSPDHLDLVGTTSEGVTLAFDVTNGVELWSVRGEPLSVGQAAVLLVVPARSGLDDIVAFDGPAAVRIEGKSGRELWRTHLAATVASAVVARDMSAPVFAVVDNSVRKLLVLNAGNGNLVSQVPLPARVVGASVAVLDHRATFLIGYETGDVELRDQSGTRIRSGSAGSPATTGPILVKGRQQDLVLIGTRDGLTAMTAADLRPLGREAIKGDAPRGNLVAQDLSGDGFPEVLMSTQRGHLIAVSSDDGKIVWDAAVDTDASAIAFADLNGDKISDVIITGPQTFALALSGRDGSTIWKDGEGSQLAANHVNNRAPRGLAIAPTSTGILLISSDVSRTSLRAIEFPNARIRW